MKAAAGAPWRAKSYLGEKGQRSEAVRPCASKSPENGGSWTTKKVKDPEGIPWLFCTMSRRRKKKKPGKRQEWATRNITLSHGPAKKKRPKSVVDRHCTVKEATLKGEGTRKKNRTPAAFCVTRHHEGKKKG